MHCQCPARIGRVSHCETPWRAAIRFARPGARGALSAITAGSSPGVSSGVFHGREGTVTKAFKALVAALAAVVSLSTLAHAQGASSIVGSVRDSSGGALPGATVTVSDSAHGVSQTMQTSPLGTFVFAQV